MLVRTLVLISSLLFACSNEPAPPPMSGPAGAEVVASEKARLTTPEVEPEDQAALGVGNRAFALDLYDQLAEDPGNLFLSPYSISVALAMTYAGAEGPTERQMAEALHFDLPEPRLHPAFNAAALALEARGETAAGSDEEPFRLHVVNRLWGQRDASFESLFLDTLALHYGAGMVLLDFLEDPDGSRVTINDWVAMMTEDRIRDLIPRGVIDASTRLVLTNAIYFNAAWDVPFEEEQTQDGPFTLLDGSTATVPLMQQTERHRYASGDGWQAVELAYDANELRMIVLLPEEGRFAEIEGGLDAAFFDGVRENLATRQTTVTLPRFEFEASFGLNDPLQALGMVDAFGGAADFSGIDGTRSLYIQAVLHKAFVSVNEAGTEAAAATAVVVRDTSAPEPAEITMDRPFLFFIVDEPTGQLLFLGRVLDPR